MNTKEREDNIAPKVLYEDSSLLVINKPSGMVVNRAESVVGETVQDWVEEYLKVPKVSEVSKVSKAFGTFGTFPSLDIFHTRSGTVHRLDKETSGILLIAKTPEVFEELQRQFKARGVEKTYVALVHGRVSPEEGIITAPVGRLPWNRERFGVFPGGRASETRYKVLSVLSSQLSGTGLSVVGKPVDRRPIDQNLKTENRKQITEYSLVEFSPKTGRTHQIRVHAKSIGHPVVSDTFYAGRKTSRIDRKWCPRLFLHASKISFAHPVGGKRMTIEAPLPEELQNALNRLDL